MIDKKEANYLLKKYLQDDKLLKHSLSVEAIMKKLAIYLRKNEELWGLVGLLHDIDYEYTIGKPENHGLLSGKILDGLLPINAINAIKAHNYIHTEQLPISTIDKALIASDALSGLIIASALVMPSKSLKEVRLQTLKKKFKDTNFAKGCNREKIKLCDDIGISVNDFLKLGLQSLKEISSVLGL
jgi:putative nucleotidyltransferase with HDIG domain